MRWRTRGVLVVLGMVAVMGCGGTQAIRLDERDAVVWSPEQVVRGHASGTDAAGTLYVNGKAIAFTAAGEFRVPVRLDEGVTSIMACARAQSGKVCSDTLRWTLGYRLRPEVHAHATVKGRTVTLHGRLLDNPDGAALTYAWHEDAENPRSFGLTVEGDTLARLTIPDDAPRGEYYFDWMVTGSDGDTSKARTFVTVDATGITPFDIARDHAAWVDRAMIYEITPHAFVSDGKLADITARIPELVALGVNTIWLQPVFATRDGGQGYDIIDYFAVRRDLGTVADLRELVTVAHAHGLKVLLDFVPNHTSLHHPYAQDAVSHGESSHYHDFYQRTVSRARYSMHEHTREVGQMDFVYYFWPELVNLNHDNPEVEQWMIEAGRYWIEELDIDGYRIDAVWGVNARTPQAMQRWRLALKRLKPEIMLLGEDKATLPAAFENRFDVAYDWYPDEEWVSHWTWQTDYSAEWNLTIFNSEDERSRSQGLRDALTNRGQGFHPDARVLRFMENNDTFRFIATHGPREVERTRMAAALIYSLPGIPLLYNGQEIGFAAHPYETESIFARGQAIQSQDPHGLFAFYQRVLALRRTYAALAMGGYEEVDVAPDDADDHVFAFRRWHAGEHVFTMLNMGASSTAVELHLPVAALGLDPQTTYYLTDMLGGECLSGQGSELAALDIDVPGYTTRLYVLGDRCIEISTMHPR